MADQIAPLPPAPIRADGANFSSIADTFLGALPTFGTEANTLATGAEADSVTATTQAGIATTQAGNAGTSETNSGNSASASASSASDSSDSADDALAAAAAAGAAAGLPAFTGKSLLPLRVNVGETGVEYADVFPSQSGQSGKFLTTNGSVKSWGNTPNDYELLETTPTLSSDSVVDFDLPAGYTTYVVEVLNVEASSGNPIVAVKTSTNGGSSFDQGASDYAHSTVEAPSTGGAADPGNPTDVSMRVSGPGLIHCGTIRIFRPSEATDTQIRAEFSTILTSSSTSPVYVSMSAGVRHSNADVDAVRIFLTTGTMVSGIMKLYGIK